MQILFLSYVKNRYFKSTTNDIHLKKFKKGLLFYSINQEGFRQISKSNNFR